jgi:hypothetical protein
MKPHINLYILLVGLIHAFTSFSAFPQNGESASSLLPTAKVNESGRVDLEDGRSFSPGMRWSKSDALLLHQVLCSSTYQHALQKKYKLSDYELKCLSPNPGVYPLNLENPSTKLQNASKALNKDLRSAASTQLSLFRLFASPEQRPEPEVYDHGDPLNKVTFPRLPANIGPFNRSALELDYRISRIRPIIPLEWDVDLVESAFTRSSYDNHGAEPELILQVKKQWNVLQKYGKSLVKIEINRRQFGTGIHIGDGKILTARHVAEQVNKGSLVHWTGLTSTEPTVAGRNIKLEDDESDIAIIITNPPASSYALDENVIKNAATVWSFSSDEFLALLTHPTKYGHFDGTNFKKIFGTPGVARACVGKLRADITPLGANRLSHDIATHNFNSGSPVFDLSTGRLVGIHVDRHQTKKVNVFSPIAKSWILKNLQSTND